MRKLVIVSLVLLGAMLSASTAGAASGFQIRETRGSGAVVLWGDRQAHPFTSCDAPLAVHAKNVIKSAHPDSTVVCEAYAGGTLKAFNLDR